MSVYPGYKACFVKLNLDLLLSHDARSLEGMANSLHVIGVSDYFNTPLVGTAKTAGNYAPVNRKMTVYIILLMYCGKGTKGPICREKGPSPWGF